MNCNFQIFKKGNKYPHIWGYMFPLLGILVPSQKILKVRLAYLLHVSYNVKNNILNKQLSF